MRIQAGKGMMNANTPTQTPGNAAEQYVMCFHDAMPGITEQLYGHARTADGQLSYALLCGAGGTLTGNTVVDLACGSGPLAERLARAVGPAGWVWGIDLNANELRLARTRLHAIPHVRFRQESAQCLSFPSASVDAVFCHMAFMLFDPAEPVVSEMARILKPGGLFAAVLPSLGESTPSFNAIREILAAQLLQEPASRRCQITNTRTASREGLQTLFSPETGFGDAMRFSHFTIMLHDTPEALVERIFPLFYAGSFLSPQGAENVKAQWRHYFEKNADRHHNALMAFPHSMICIHRSAG